MEFTVPLTFGVHDVIAYGAVALKLNTFSRARLAPFWLILVKVPTANIFPPHSASCRICSVFPVDASVGVPAAGVGDTRRVAATLAGAARADAEKQHQAVTAMPAISAEHVLRLPRGRYRSCSFMSPPNDRVKLRR